MLFVLRFGLILALLLSLLPPSAVPAAAQSVASSAGDDLSASSPRRASGTATSSAADSRLGPRLRQVVEAGARGVLADSAERLGARVEGRQVLVTIEAVDGRADDAAAAVAASGGRVTARFEGWLDALLPVDAAPGLAAHPSVRQVELPVPWVAEAVAGEGGAVLGAPAWHAAGLDGSGVKVGIIDGGFAGYASLLGSDLPASINTSCSPLPLDNGVTHGTAVAQIVHEVAPAAELYLVTMETLTQVGNAVSCLANAGVTVVNHSVGWLYHAPGNGTGAMNSIVANAVSRGILWSNSTGNYQQRHWSGTWGSTDGDVWLEFYRDSSGGLDETQTINLTAGQYFLAGLRWNDTWGSSCNDYDLYLFSDSLNIVAWSEGIQDCSADPLEVISYVAPVSGTYHLAVAICNNAALGCAANGAARFNLITPSFALQHQVAGNSLLHPADSASGGMLSVGAVRWSTPDTLETFSSMGPTTDGRVKPDLVAPDGVTTTLGSFFGTSAAAPHAAGAAALVREAYPAHTPAQIKTFLVGRTVDLGTVGADNAYGRGRLAMGVVPDTTPPPAPLIGQPLASMVVNAPAFTVAGTAEAGALVRVWRDTNNDGVRNDAQTTPVASQQLGPAATAFSINVPLVQNAVNHLLVTATDAAGNQSAAADLPPVTEDSTAPSALPTLVAPSGQTAVKSGDAVTIGGAATGVSEVLFSGDSRLGGRPGTRLVQVNATGTPISGADIVLSAAHLVLDNGAYSGTLTLAGLATGVTSLRLVAVVQDAAGNQATLASNTLRVDQAVPARPTITAPLAAVTVNVRPLPGGSAFFTIRGRGEPGTAVRVWVDADDSGTRDEGEAEAVYLNPLTGLPLAGSATPPRVALDGTFAASVVLAEGMADGPATNTFVVTLADAAGNTSPPANVPTITEDSVAPDAPTFTRPVADVVVGGGWYTLEGTAEPGAVIKVFRDATPYGTRTTADTLVAPLDPLTGRPLPTAALPVRAGSDGTFIYAVPLVQGATTPGGASAANRFLAVATDAAANESAAAFAPVVHEDSAGAALTLAVSPVTFSPLGGSTTNATTITYTLREDAAVRVWVLGGTLTALPTPLPLTVRDLVTPGALLAAGTYTVTWDGADDAGGTVADGVYTVAMRAADAYGNVTTRLAAVRVDGPISSPRITDPAAPKTVNADTDPSAVDNNSYVVRGTADAGATVAIYRDVLDNGQLDGDDVLLGSQTLGATVTTFAITVALLPDSTNSLIAVSSRSDLISEAANVPTLTEDSTAPSAPSVTTPAAGGTVVNAPRFTIEGAAEPGSRIRVYRDLNDDGDRADSGEVLVAAVNPTTGALLTTPVLAGSDSRFAYTIALIQGSGPGSNAVQNLVVTSTDPAGNESSAANVPTITEDSFAPTGVPTLGAPSGQTAVKEGDAIAIGGTATGVSEVLFSGDSRLGSRPGTRLVQLNASGVPISGADIALAADVVRLGSGAYSGTLTLATPHTLARGLRLVIVARDLAGNEASLGSTVLRVDTLAPAAPRITVPLTVVTVNATAYTIRGTGEPGATVRVWVDANDDGLRDRGEAEAVQVNPTTGATLATPVRVAADGTFGVAVPLAENAPNTFVVTQVDGAANESAAANVPTIVEDSTPPTLSGLGAMPDRFTANGTARVTLPFTLGEAARVKVEVFAGGSASGTPLRTLVNDTAPRAAGSYTSVTWDGRNAAGTLVAAGAYTYRVTATDRYGNSESATSSFTLVR